jgi:hypothetical protein
MQAAKHSITQVGALPVPLHSITHYADEGRNT